MYQCQSHSKSSQNSLATVNGSERKRWRHVGGLDGERLRVALVCMG